MDACRSKEQKDDDPSSVPSNSCFITDPDEDPALTARSKTPTCESPEVVPSKRLTAAQRLLPRKNDPSWSTEYAHQLMKRVGMPIDSIDEGLVSSILTRISLRCANSRKISSVQQDSEENQRTARTDSSRVSHLHVA